MAPPLPLGALSGPFLSSPDSHSSFPRVPGLSLLSLPPSSVSQPFKLMSSRPPRGSHMPPPGQRLCTSLLHLVGRLTRAWAVAKGLLACPVTATFPGDAKGRWPKLLTSFTSTLSEFGPASLQACWAAGMSA